MDKKMKGEKDEAIAACEICQDDRFIGFYCTALGNDPECHEMTRKAGTGEISEEEYFAWALEKYGGQKAEQAMNEATRKMTESIVDSVSGGNDSQAKDLITIRGAGVPGPGVASVAGPAPGVPGASAKAAAQKQQPSNEDGTGAEAEIDAKLKREEAQLAKLMSERLGDANAPKYKSNIAEICVPCVGDPWTSICNITKLWFTKAADIAVIDKVIMDMRTGTKPVEEAIAEVMLLKDGPACIDAVLTAMNEAKDVAAQIAVRKDPSLKKTLLGQ